MIPTICTRFMRPSVPQSEMPALCELFGGREKERGFGAALHGDPAPEPQSESQEPARAVSDLIEWLAGATGQPAEVLYRRVSSRIGQLASSVPARIDSRPSLSRQLLAEELIAYYGREKLASVGLSPYELR